jgi:VanZ family protein
LPGGVSAPRLALAIAVSIAVVVSAPFVGDLRTFLTSQLGPRFVPVVNGGFAALAVVLIGVTMLRIRDRRVLRYGLLAAAAGLAVMFGRGTAASSAVTRAVERFHFFEYGLIALLYCRANRTRPHADPGPYLLAVLSALIVGTAEEALQWFVPDRIGELADVFLNLSAIAVGLLVALALDPPQAFTWRIARSARAGVARLAAVTLLGLALFVRVVHLGTWVGDREVRFKSRYSADQIGEAGAARAASWARRPPAARPPALSREDQYLTEALWHVQARNTAWDAGQATAALGEQQILERYFASVLRLGHDWPAAQRSDAERRAAPAAALYESHAERLPIWTWSLRGFWMAVIVLAIPLAAAGAGRAGAEKRSNRDRPGSDEQDRM